MIRLLITCGLALPACAVASELIPVRMQNHLALEAPALTARLQTYFQDADAREIRVRQVSAQTLIVRLLSKRYHSFESVRVTLSPRGEIIGIDRQHRLTRAERLNVHFTPSCPDAQTEFISFAPNNDDFEQGVATDVAAAAQAHGLKTVLLLGSNATRVAYLNYMTCPLLKGNFYDGDANPFEMVTADDSVTADDFRSLLTGAFRFKVTNIWLACEAFNDPMRGSVIDDAQTQKYAAGVNNLLVGPSDRAAACTMKAALDGQPMTAAFQACYAQLDDPADHWGFDGHGSDLFGQ